MTRRDWITFGIIAVVFGGVFQPSLAVIGIVSAYWVVMTRWRDYSARRDRGQT